MWNLANARVVCKQLGFHDVLKYNARTYGPGSGKILMDDVQCGGTEATLQECQFNGWGLNNCAHNEDVGVICLNDTAPRIRLVNGSTKSEGRVEILYSKIWGTVRDDYWTFVNSRVVCRELGYSDANETKRFGNGKSGQIIWLDDVLCNGTETGLSKCSFRAWGYHDCDHSEDVGVQCSTDDVILPPSAAVRLTGSPVPYSGTAEVFHEGRWGTICSQNWNTNGALVFCRQLGYDREIAAFSNSYYRDGSQPSWMIDVRCWGVEKGIEDCPFIGWHQSSCPAGKSAGVLCGKFGNGSNEN
ncbi:neurotrypsin-like [Oscarella lobularis]|uniref:neurotrypsin-like n=1 Tax=Oscarella lobularis TaxID=121494 RepID=UPI003313BFC9